MESYVKLNKTQARKAFNHGVTIHLLPSEYREDVLDSIWGHCSISLLESNADFDSLVNSFEYYNCSYRKGIYAHYYITEKYYEALKMCELMC